MDRFLQLDWIRGGGVGAFDLKLFIFVQSVAVIVNDVVENSLIYGFVVLGGVCRSIPSSLA